MQGLKKGSRCSCHRRQLLAAVRGYTATALLLPQHFVPIHLAVVGAVVVAFAADAGVVWGSPGPC